MASRKKRQKALKKRTKAPKGWKYDEFGELKKKLSKKPAPISPSVMMQAEADIMDRLAEKVTQDIHAREDRNLFRGLNLALLSQASIAFLGSIQARLRRFRQDMQASLTRLEEEIEDALIQHLLPPPKKDKTEKPKSTKKRKR